MHHHHHQIQNVIVAGNHLTNDNIHNIHNNDNNIYLNPLTEFININTVVFDDDTSKKKKKTVVVKNRVLKKKDACEFRIPTSADHAEFMNHEYKVSELKDICKHHGIKCGGTKQELKMRIHAHLHESHFITRIQRLVRRNFIKMHARVSGPAYHDRSLCVNDTDFYSMEPMNDIPRNQFISVKDDSGMVYGFDMISLNTYCMSERKNGTMHHGEPLSNPYNRMPFPLTLLHQMHRKFCLTHILGVGCMIESEPEPVQSAEQQADQLLFIVFQQINAHGHYADTAWFGELTGVQILRFMRELADIWNYRAQIIPQLKQEICPPNGDPFRHLDIRYMHPETIKHNAIQLMNTFVASGTTQDSRGLGAYYVLSALTLVSQSARNAMPWLYESVMYVAPN
jgi:SAP domain-containing new25